ncbi:major facilitator superfamily domain-containing protein [Paraphoma chrysanthemicola]|uniref:Major facilitator superfamily domain-containing protein n=1 Tax=Paraphoma chrysanthemicola TaxID=798071 RepID=A0A8K0RHJ1_9PLEO|nr:major facilitator superfamily domain-containing protein [Paraphoma chrysanthemicola]
MTVRTTTDDTESSPLLDGDEQMDEDVLRPGSHKLDVSLAIKIASTMVSFSTLGLFNSSIGAVLPLLSSYYHLSDLHVSLLFLAGPAGYILAAQSSDTIHRRFGQRGIAFVGPMFQILATFVIATHSSFGLVLIGFALQGLGTGLLDGSWCAWAGSMENANTISGLLHGSYSVGGAAGPFVVTLITTNRLPWYLWYYALGIQTVFELLVLLYAFRNETGSVYRQSKRPEVGNTKPDTRAIFHYLGTWLCAMYFLAYVGTETAISGWVVSFMLRKRSATPYMASLSSSGFWIGMAVGRLLLGFGTDRIGVRRATILYFFCAILLQLLFIAWTSPIVSVIVMILLGFTMGPMFPSGIVVLTRLLPAELHIAAVSFVSSLGQVGGAALPFAIGAVVDKLGIGIFQYAILMQTAAAVVVWLVFARLHSVAQNQRLDASRELRRED